MRIGVCHHDSSTTATAVSYTPQGSISQVHQPIRHNVIAGTAEVAVAFGANLQTLLTETINFVYVGNMASMVAKSNSVFSGTNANPSLTSSTAANSGTMNEQGDFLVAYDSLLNTSSASYSTNINAIRIAAPGAGTVHPDFSFLTSGRWINSATALPEVDSSTWDRKEQLISLSFRGLSVADAALMFPNIMRYQGKRAFVLWDNNVMFPGFFYRICALKSYSMGISQNEIYNATLTLEIL